MPKTKVLTYRKALNKAMRKNKEYRLCEIVEAVALLKDVTYELAHGNLAWMISGKQPRTPGVRYVRRGVYVRFAA